MNKKILYGVLLPIFAVLLVSAGLITYYGQIQTTITVNQPIEVGGNTSQSILCEAGLSCDGTEITIENDGTQEIDILIEDVTDEDGITTSYTGELQLTKKVVNFNSDNWEILNGERTKVQIEYTVVGDEFSAEVIDNPQEEYVLIYYKDNSERFTNPAQAILVGDVVDNLPYDTDGNVDEYDYCDTGEYSTCHGAKIWYVPSDAINEDDSLNWNRANEFYFESELIQYNSAGVITTYPGHTFVITPSYDLDLLLNESGNPYTIVTKVNPIA